MTPQTPPVILVVGNDKPLLERVCAALEADEFSTHTASDGIQALERLCRRDSPINLVITAQALPRMDGLSLCRAVKDHDRLSGTPILFLAPKTDENTLSRIFSAGAWDCILPPYTPEVIRTRVRGHIRIAALENKILSLKREKASAEKASLAKTRFLSRASHEIRTPMNGITGMAELLLSTPLSPEQMEFVQGIRRSGEGATSLVNDLLDLSKIEAGKMETETIDLNLETLIRQVILTISPGARQKGVDLAWQIDRDVPVLLLGDANRLSQILMNLAGNGVKFTDKGEVGISVFLAAKKKDSIRLRFEVRDTGIGIPRDQIQNLFTPFSQTDTSIARRYGGTGLGLSICKELVELLGGKIGVKSQLGQGSTFWFTTSFKKNPRPNQPIISPASTVQGQSDALPTVTGFKERTKNRYTLEEPGRPDKPMGSLNILLAEDNRINQKVAMNLLDKLGHGVFLAENGEKALELYQNRPFDLILMDGQMPVMDGIEATQAIRKLESEKPPPAPHIPIVALTANAMEGDREKFIAAGMDDYITKPITRKSLKNAICRTLGTATERGAARNQTPVIDLDRLIKTMGGSKQLVKECFDEFSRTHTKTLDSLRKDMENHNFSRISSVLELFRDGIKPLYCKPLMDAAFSFDRAAAAKDGPGMETAFSALSAACTRVEEFIATYSVRRLFMKFLVMDGNFESRQAAQSLLARYGECHTALDGNEVIKAHSKAIESGDPYHMIVLDRDLPGLDIPQTIREIQKQENLQSIVKNHRATFVLISGLDPGPPSELEWENTIFLEKPLTRESIAGVFTQAN